MPDTALPTNASPTRRRRNLQDFLEMEHAAGACLLGATVLALVLRNSPIGHSFEEFWHQHAIVMLGPVEIDESLVHWVNDGLMAIFFFVAGLEIKRELAVGELSDVRRASLPAIAALGGMIVPALIYTVINLGGDGASGWGIPLATDIAFAVAVLGVVGNKLPSGLKVFLLSLAIADDIGAVMVIALFYSSSISFTWLGVVAGLIALVILMRRLDIWFVPAYVFVGVGLWVAMLESGVHATLAGVILGLMAPAVARKPRKEATELDPSVPFGLLREVLSDARETVPVTDRLLHILHPWTAFVILPLFALANGGVELSAQGAVDAATSPITAGVVFGLVLGKSVGIVLATRFAVAAGIGVLPEGVSWRMINGVGFLCGIGFTVSLFVSNLAFDNALFIDNAKIGVLTASAIAAGAGIVTLRRAAADAPPVAEETEVDHEPAMAGSAGV